MSKLDVDYVICPTCQNEWYEDELLRLETEKIFTLKSIKEKGECPSCLMEDDEEYDLEDDYSENFFYYDFGI